jgi:hypothetical protein
MSLGRSVSFIGLGAWFILGVVGGCDGTPGTTNNCAVGNERCACYGNKTCNEGLVCRSDVCVAEGRGTGGEANSSSEAGTTNVSSNGGTSPVTGQAGANNLGSGGTGENASGGATTIGTGGTIVAAAGSVVNSTGGVHLVATGGSTVVARGGGVAVGGTTATGGSSVASAGAWQLGPNQISNGDFSQDGTYWHVTDSTYGDPLNVSSIVEGAFCVTGSSYAPVIGYPELQANAVYLQPGGTYALIFRATATASVSLAPKVGYAISPWTSVYAPSSTSISTTWKEYRYSFVANITTTVAETTPMGLAFTVGSLYSGDMFCLDDVVLALIMGA